MVQRRGARQEINSILRGPHVWRKPEALEHAAGVGIAGIIAACVTPTSEIPLDGAGSGDQVRSDRPSVVMACSIGVGRSQLAWRLSSPPLECMSECTHLMKAEQPRNLGYMHLAVVEVTNG